MRNEKNKVVLFNAEDNCSGCGACMNACPNSAIEMYLNDLGCLYPIIDESKCIQCKLCKTVCNYQNKTVESSRNEVHVAATRNDTLIRKSSSGGVFSAIAKQVLENKGVVYGCANLYKNNKLVVKHIGIESLEGLSSLQGSKYVQSDLGYIYSEVKEKLEEGKIVLFSGTPCQIDGLKGFLKNKEYTNLYTIDIICHGVPGQKLFNDYIEYLSHKKIKGKIVDFTFRDKTEGWGHYIACVDYRKQNGEIKNKLIPSYMSSYYSYFLKGEIYRENCYSCKYAGKNRVGDITIGDCWGIEQEHPEYLEEKGGDFQVSKGISCILVNNKKGQELLELYSSELMLKPTKFEKLKKWNQQLNIPSKHTQIRNDIRTIYGQKGYPGIEKYFVKTLGLRYYYRLFKAFKKKLLMQKKK